ncbi:hypothetical protein JCM3774_003080 [Rhodotorula dairenensis]
MPRTRRDRTAVLQAGDAREPIGPPSALLPDAAAFADRVQAALDKATAELDRIKADWANATPEQDARLKERCSVQALQEENKALLENQLIRPDLRNWIERRWYPGAHGSQALDGEATGDDDDEAEKEQGSTSEPVRKKKKQSSHADEEILDFGQDVDLVGEEELAMALKEAEASELNLLKPPLVEKYLRKIRTADANCLLAMRATERDDPLPSFPPRDAKAARVLYSVTVHPAPHGPGTQHIPQQKLACLGTTTLAEIRDNLLVGGDNIPVEESAADDDADGTRSDDEAEDGESEADAEGAEGADGDGFDYSAQPPPPAGDEFFGGGVTAPSKPVEVRWKNERRSTGAAFIVEGTVYADQREGMQDYASSILDAIEETAWPGQPQAPAFDDAAAPTDNDHLTPLRGRQHPGGPSELQRGAADPRPLRPHRGKPTLRGGPRAHEVTLGEMPLRVGQPYGFVHQGDVEHIWSVDEIRALHPADPSPWPPELAHKRSNAYLQFRSPYPITTYLSRLSTHTVSNARCRLCERDAVDLALVGDALAGESPAHVCRACFGTLHPVRRDWEDEARPKKRARGRPKRVATPPPLGYEEVHDDAREHMDGVRTVPVLYER